MRSISDATLRGGVLLSGMCVALSVFLAPHVVRAQAAPATPSAVTTTDVVIPLRDGTRLVGRLLQSVEPGRSAPRRDSYLELRAGRAAAAESLAVGLARRAWSVIVVEPRSGEPIDTDLPRLGRDGAEIVDWVARQGWSTGKVLMFGSGEAAVAQWATAQQRPSRLVAIAPRTPSRGWWGGPADSSRVAIPVLTWGPGFTEPQGALIDSYQRHIETASSAGAQQHYLAIGSIGPLDQVLLLDGWGRWAVGREALPALLHKRVNYMMDDGTWFSVDSIGAIGAQATGYPLHSPDDAARAPGGSGAGFLGGGALVSEMTDSVPASGSYRYETMAYEASADLLGRPTVVLWMRGASRGTPEVTLEEVRGDGQVVHLGRARGRLRTMVSDRGGAARWEFTAFPWIARRVVAGNRIRMTIGGVAGAVVLHDRESYSRVVMPLVGNGRRPVVRP